MSVRKRSWTTKNGVEKETWVVDYFDQKGKRRLKSFSRKKEADTWHSTAAVEVRDGVHVPDRASETVTSAGTRWIKSAKANGLERSTTDQYQQHLDLHITPFIGSLLLSKLTPPAVAAFRDRLRDERRSPAMVRKVMTSLSSLLADAQENGSVVRNVARELRGRRKRGQARQADKRQKGKLKPGNDFPTRAEAKAIVDTVKGRWRPLLLTAIFCGPRASELRGLRWTDIDFTKREIRVRQRADRFNAIGAPKSGAGEREIPMTPMVVTALKEWRLSCPKRDTGKKDAAGKPIKELHFVFPNGVGKVEALANIINRGLVPTLIAAGVVMETGKKDKDENPIIRAKYSGMHALRHFYASWCINRKEEGGLALPAKVVQERLGHSSIVMTMDVYGHLFPRGDDADELAAAETALLA